MGTLLYQSGRLVRGIGGANKCQRALQRAPDRRGFVSGASRYLAGNNLSDLDSQAFSGTQTLTKLFVARSTEFQGGRLTMCDTGIWDQTVSPPYRDPHSPVFPV